MFIFIFSNDLCGNALLQSGTKCSDDLRHKLQTAMKSKNKNELEKAIDECRASGFRELMQDVEKANAILVSVGGKRRG